ncbi:hypothetical protein C2E23DRAFT_224678 [Lenzites betulinus]|nr:hypothetical protein C2E23DRAFT_224678 [Lenzites betulinus]
MPIAQAASVRRRPRAQPMAIAFAVCLWPVAFAPRAWAASDSFRKPACTAARTEVRVRCAPDGGAAGRLPAPPLRRRNVGRTLTITGVPAGLRRPPWRDGRERKRYMCTVQTGVQCACPRRCGPPPVRSVCCVLSMLLAVGSSSGRDGSYSGCAPRRRWPARARAPE